MGRRPLPVCGRRVCCAQREAIKGLLKKTGVAPTEIDYVSCGTVIQEDFTSNIAREAAMAAVCVDGGGCVRGGSSAGRRGEGCGPKYSPIRPSTLACEGASRERIGR